MDIFNTKKRSEIMTLVRSKGNKSTEVKLMHNFKKEHIKGWRRNCRLFGSPDFVFVKNRFVVFVDGCFWHGHDCRNLRPKDNKEFWRKKRDYNKQHDRIVNRTLRKQGWNVIRIWECEIDSLKTINKVKKGLKFEKSKKV